jgi:hypothetical protein
VEGVLGEWVVEFLFWLVCLFSRAKSPISGWSKSDSPQDAVDFALGGAFCCGWGRTIVFFSVWDAGF